jgi:hypothetical protein
VTALEVRERIKPIAAKRNLFPILTAGKHCDKTLYFAEDPEATLRASDTIEATDEAAAWHDFRRTIDDHEYWQDYLDGEWSYDIPRRIESYTIGEALNISNPPKVALRFLPGAGPIDALSHLKFGGDSPQTELIIAYLRQWDERYGIDVISARSNTLELHISRPPSEKTDALRMARECVLLCSDLLEQMDDYLGFKCNNVCKLAAHLMGTTYLCLWWD